MMKAILLNDGGYFGLEEVSFPVEVDCEFDSLDGMVFHDLLRVSAEELIRIGIDPICLTIDTESLSFFEGKHIELKSENAK